MEDGQKDYKEWKITRKGEWPRYQPHYEEEKGKREGDIKR